MHKKLKTKKQKTIEYFHIKLDVISKVRFKNQTT